MSLTKHENFNHPREQAVTMMRSTLTSEAWERNANFVRSLKSEIENHPISRHPVIEILNNCKIDGSTLQRIHLEYRYAIVQSFTDALLAAQLQSRQLEPRLKAGSKMAPRFLLTLNSLDEFGFRPGLDVDGYYLGNPGCAHYPLYEAVLDDLKLSEAARRAFVPSSAAALVRQVLEESFGNYVDVTALLAVAEHEVILFTPPLRRATGRHGIDVDDGYYFVHGVSDDDTANAADDDHASDLWNVLTHAITEADYERVIETCKCYIDLWSDFWDQQIVFMNAPTRDTEHSIAHES
ncbi:hypothetical protein R75461_08399 [Paraburkholderia nemoris]|uniref:hypothetical protein n=1 Tax=Paraburkholderia nemoris TaxID=2793076 RepID=UPI0019096E1A|nr:MULTISPECIES: hypothetical protein [Paraburkholderia]MBK3787173.1 iron-containing redox enzyme family protein [Paraburkholderia aspalathi]CAE6867950.1 hypothetical protein R75461_08399 [Paraburkholderia nemoris]